MSAAQKAGANSYVLLQIGKRRLALPAGIVAELAPPVRLQTFPHTSAFVAGVIVRRGRIVPVYDASSVLAERSSSSQRFFLIARRRMGTTSEFAALPVNGECELVTGQMQPRTSERPDYVAGTLTIGGESLDVLNLEALVASSATDSKNSRGAEAHS